MAAFGLPEMPDIVKSIPGMGGDPSDSADLDLDSLMDTQTELVGKVSDALLALSTSQTKMAEALGLKEMAAIATANAESLESGGLTGEDDMEKQLSSTMSVNETIQEKMESGVELDAAGKAKFAEALPFYGKGAFYNLFADNPKDYTEIDLGLDFFNIPDDFETDFIITNPPYSIMTSIIEKMMNMTNLKGFGLLVNNLTMTPKRLQTFEENGFYPTDLYMMNIYNWFGYTYFWFFEKLDVKPKVNVSFKKLYYNY